MEAFIKSLSLKKQVGAGGFGKVFLASNNEGTYAIKAISKSRNQEANIAREVYAGETLNHKNIINFICEFEDETNNYMVFDYIRGYDLFTFLEKRGFKTFTETEARFIMRQLLSAISYCHSNGVVHLDLKLDNIMINPDTLEVTVIDFGLCDFITDENQGMFSRRVGSEEYAPVELLEKEKPFDGTKVDVFCLGVVLFAILSATFPFDAKKRKETIRSGLPLPALKFPFAVSDECKDLMTKMLESNPEKRISIAQIFEHSWVSKL